MAFRRYGKRSVGWLGGGEPTVPESAWVCGMIQLPQHLIAYLSLLSPGTAACALAGLLGDGRRTTCPWSLRCRRDLSEVRAVRARVGQLGAVEKRTVDADMVESTLLKAGVADIRKVEIGLVEVALRKGYAVQLRPVQVGLSTLHSADLGPLKPSALKVESRCFDIGPCALRYLGVGQIGVGHDRICHGHRFQPSPVHTGSFQHSSPAYDAPQLCTVQLGIRQVSTVHLYSPQVCSKKSGLLQVRSS